MDNMKVYKFGGASVKDAAGVRNIASIVGAEKGRLFVIVSAMGKTTNALEGLLDTFYDGKTALALERLQNIVDFHNRIIAELWGRPFLPDRVARFYMELEETVASSNPAVREYEVWYDRIVGYGELISTSIVSEYLAAVGIANTWVDMRECFVTTARHKDANVDLERSAERLVPLVEAADSRVYVGQGFIGATEDGAPTTIGREGSDYSAAAAGYILGAESVTIWKDVEGILNGDPKRFDDVRHIPEMNYLDAIELAYSGAQVIHPKTIKPLQNRNIPLHVRCFLDPALPGSVIRAGVQKNREIPILIVKPSQVLLTVRANDFSFPTLANQPLYFLGYLIVQSIQMGANIDYAIVISSHYQELKATMTHKEAIVEALNASFPTIFTSGTILSAAALLIGNISTNPVISILGTCLGRGTIISIVIVLGVLPATLVLSDSIINRTSFKMKGIELPTRTASGTMYVSGHLRGQVSGVLDGEFTGTIRGDMHAIVSTSTQVKKLDEAEGGEDNA